MVTLVSGKPNQDANPYLGVGLYTVAEAARILQESRARVSRWVRGYQYVTASGIKEQRAYFDRDLEDVDGTVILSFADLIELKFVQLFLREGVRPNTIRLVHDKLRETYGIPHPFTAKQVRTDGRRLFELVGNPEDPELCYDIERSQSVITEVAAPFFRTIEYADNRARRLCPLGLNRRVILDPELSFGAPIERRSGVPTHTLFQMSKAGESVEAIADWYEVDPEGVNDAIEYEQRLAA